MVATRKVLLPRDGSEVTQAEILAQTGYLAPLHFNSSIISRDRGDPLVPFKEGLSVLRISRESQLFKVDLNLLPWQTPRLPSSLLKS